MPTGLEIQTPLGPSPGLQPAPRGRTASSSSSANRATLRSSSVPAAFMHEVRHEARHGHDASALVRWRRHKIVGRHGVSFG